MFCFVIKYLIFRQFVSDNIFCSVQVNFLVKVVAWKDFNLIETVVTQISVPGDI
jgi:hypothetical protein